MIGSWLRVISIVLVSGFFAGSAFAVLPDSGWYWNPNESGRGFNLEIQNNSLFIAGFIYDTAGNPIWVYSGGPMSTDRTYSGAAFRTANGQPLGGAYHSPTNVPFGTATITFTTTTSALVTINGFNFSVTRQIFGFDFGSVAQPLLGEFAFNEGINGLYFGERITFTRTQTVNGTLYAVGSTTSAPARQALGTYSALLNQWTILLDSSTNYYNFFKLTFIGLNLLQGTSSTYLKGESASGGLPAIGHRIRSAQAAAGGNAPGLTDIGIGSSDAIAADISAALKASAHVVQQVDAADISVARELARALQAIGN